MKFSFYLPTEILFGRFCLREHAAALALGKHAFLVTGKRGAKASGALDEVLAALDAAGITHTIFDEIAENPPLLLAARAGALACKVGADFVIGIGGGSALDAAKAIAAFATNPDLAPDELYDAQKRKNASLPLVAVPTTAGTGSEANPYSVLTLPDGTHKKTFTARDNWFRVAFVDPRYTESLSREVTISTALDAFAHAMESYLSPKSTPFSEGAALFAGKKLWGVLSQDPACFTEQMRDDLALGSCVAGMAISVTGTGFPHPLGYSITLLDGIAHGRACAVFAGDYITYNQKSEVGRARLAAFAEALGTTPTALASTLPALAAVSLSLTEAQIKERVDLISGAKNYVNSPYVLSVDEMFDIYRAHFLKK